jgi:hypothetical protein
MLILFKSYLSMLKVEAHEHIIRHKHSHTYIIVPFILRSHTALTNLPTHTLMRCLYEIDGAAVLEQGLDINSSLMPL